MYRYLVSGFSIVSGDPIPGWRSTTNDGPVDIVVSVRPGAPLSPSMEPSESIRYCSPERFVDDVPVLTVWSRSTGGYRLRYAEGAEFIIDADGTEVEVRWAPVMTAQDALIYLVGPVLGFLMRLRGALPLHASAVVVNGRALMFAGDAGAGKSTTAAAFALLGHPVLADDVVRIEAGPDDVLAYPSQARVSMWPETVAAMYGTEDALPALTPTYGKRYLDLEAGHLFQATPVPVEVIYLLSNRSSEPDASRGETIEPRAALLGLVSNTYCNYLLDAPMRGREFDVLSRVVDRVSVRRVTFGDGIDQLARSCQALAHQISRTARSL